MSNIWIIITILFEVYTAAKIKIVVFWVLKLYDLVDCYHVYLKDGGEKFFLNFGNHLQ